MGELVGSPTGGGDARVNVRVFSLLRAVRGLLSWRSINALEFYLAAVSRTMALRVASASVRLVSGSKRAWRVR